LKVLDLVGVSERIEAINFAVLWVRLDDDGQRRGGPYLELVTAETPDKALDEIVPRRVRGRLDQRVDATVYPITLTVGDVALTVNNRFQRADD
jgi:hypothetical protein